MPSLFRLPPRLRRRARRSRIRTMTTALLVVLLFFTPLYFVYKPPPALIQFFQRRWPDVLWNVRTSEKIVALTIDDGPSQYTVEIADELERNGAHATFFIIGSQVEGREQQLRRLVLGGHELGNHAMRDEPSRSLDDGALVGQIGAVEAMLDRAYDAAGATTRPPKYFRPGSGFFSSRMRGLMGRLGYRLVLGSIYPHDPQISNWELNARHVLSMLRPGGIIICHDRRPWTLPMLQKVLPAIRERGYRIVTVTELLQHGDSVAVG